MSGFDPRKTYTLSLDCFASISEPERPMFFYRRINGAEYIEISKVTELEGQSFTQQGDSIYNALRIGLTDWKNQTDPASGEAVEFDPAKLSSVIDPIEAMELVNKRLFASRLNGTQLKNSDSQSS